MDFVRDSVFNYPTYSFETEPIQINKYFEDYSKLLISVEKCNDKKCKFSEHEDIKCGKDDCKNDKFFTDYLGISNEELKELKERTSIKHLTCDGELEPVSHEFYKRFEEDSLKPKSDIQENSTSSLTSPQARAEMAVFLKNVSSRKYYRYCNYQWFPINEHREKLKLNFNSSDSSNILVSLKVYYPILSVKSKALNFKILQEIHILGSQTLADLRDKILCNLDYISGGDISNECFLKDVGLVLTDKDVYPSSFIFIEDTFYNDTRKPECIDLSSELREWAAKKGMGSFKTASMEETIISSLKLRLGRPFVYQHQGDCEHLIVFSEIRFLSLGDVCRLTAYPYTYCTGRHYGKHCMMCAETYARYIVTESERLTHDKAYLCAKCFFSYNYINGAKVGNFKAYKYVDPVALLG